MKNSMTIYRSLSAYRNARGPQIHQLSDGTRRVLRRLIDLGVWDG